MESINPHRLPYSVAPVSYDLWLRPDLEAAVFAGAVSIVAQVHEPTTQIVLNAIELDVRSATVTSANGTSSLGIALDDDLERLTLTAGAPLDPGHVTIDLTFTGVLNDKLRGFYRSTFADDDGTEHTIATTQFESTNARRCFPCWDEPDRKATFAVSLEVPDHLLAVSAQSETTRTPVADDYVRISFAPTPLMSTYLLAFVVGPLEASDAIDVDGIPVRIIHRPGRGDEIGFAHDAAVFCLRWLTDYFGVPYFGEKIDLLAIPDFAFGAMENTGCVTFREVLLLVDPTTTTQPEQQRSVAVIAHELAHMWFGNLVTMQWWEGLWLKEAFATFMETSATDAYRPDWKVWEGFALDRTAAYEVDCLHSTRPIEFEVVSPADAEGMYDVLTYEKGASVVRMLEQFVGPDNFREGIRRYMADHALGNTVTADLWRAIETATDEPVEQIMHNWINQGGFPLVSVALSDGDDGTAATIELDQRPFHLLGDSPSPNEPWSVPVVVACGEARHDALLAPTASIPTTTADATVIVDPESVGYFRSRYSPELARRLAEQFERLTAVQRYAVVDDQFNLMLSGDSDVATYVQLARSARNESSPSVWTSLSSGFATLAHLAPDRDSASAVGAAWEQIAQPELDRVGVAQPVGETDPLLNEVRAQLFGSLGSLSRSAVVVAKARELVASADETTNASLMSAAVRVVASNGDRSDFGTLFDRFRHASSPQLERRYLFSLARFDDSDAINDLCQRSIDGTVRSQDAGFLLGATLANRWHGAQVWDFVVANWQAIVDHVPENSIGRMLGGVQWLAHDDLALRVHAFLDEHPVPQARLGIAQHRERLDVHVALRQRLAERFGDQLG